MQALNFVFNSELVMADLSLSAASVGSEQWLKTVVYTSLFTNRRDLVTGEQGYWGDVFSDDSYGSLLWTLAREKLHAPTLQRARDYARDSLRWLLSGGHVTQIEVDATALSATRMRLLIILTLPDGQVNEQTEEFDLAA